MNDQKENFLRGFESFSQSVKLFCSESCGSERRLEIKEQLNIVMKELQNVLVEMDFVANNISLLVTHIEVLTDKLDIDCKRFTSNDDDVEPVFVGINKSCSNCRRHHHHNDDNNCDDVSTHRLGQILMTRAPMSRAPMPRAPMSRAPMSRLFRSMDSTQHQQNIMTSSETAVTSPFYFESDQSGHKPHESATPNVVSRNFCPCCDASSTSTSQDTGYCGYYEKELEDRLETDHRSSDCHCSPSGAQDCDATCRLELSIADGQHGRGLLLHILAAAL